MSEKITGIKIKKDDGTYTAEIPISVQLENIVGAGTAASKDVAENGNASTTQVVMGNDTRLTEARIASDVYSWAKASTKPIYTPTEVGAIPATLKGANNGVAELDANGLVPSAQLPSYVDDVLEYETKTSFPTTGETGKIYVDKAAVTLDTLLNHVDDLSAKDKTQVVQVKGDKDIPYDKIFQVMNKLVMGGYQKLSLIAETQ